MCRTLAVQLTSACVQHVVLVLVAQATAATASFVELGHLQVNLHGGRLCAITKLRTVGAIPQVAPQPLLGCCKGGDAGAVGVVFDYCNPWWHTL